MARNDFRFDSLCAREWEERRTTRPHVLPLYPTSSFTFGQVEEGMEIFSGKEQGHVYGRYGNPTMEAVAEKIARLEDYEAQCGAGGLMFSSGMAAIASLMLGLLKSGDKVLTQGNLYGGTTELLTKVLGPLGIETILTELHDLGGVENHLRRDPAIRMLYFETPANPSIACVDIEALAALARQYECFSAVDNTFATPYLQQPLRWGVDFVVHSTTKYLNGHGNSVAGVLVARDAAQVRMGGAVWQVMKLAGTNANPWDAWLVHNGMKTLALRMERHCSNALQVARFLENHPKVERVNYCGLPSHPDHAIARKQMKAFGGMLSFELAAGYEGGIRFMNALRLCTLAPTLGDVDTLVLHPASMSHLNVPRDVRLANGITDGLVRISVGIENPEDILEDLERALEKV